jgi:hypothetical protein
MEDIEITEEELLLLESPSDFHKWLYSLHAEIEITNVDEMIVFYESHKMEWNVNTLKTFKKYILDE